METQSVESVASAIAAEFWRHVRAREVGTLLNADGYEQKLADIMRPIMAGYREQVEVANAERDLAVHKLSKANRTLAAVKRTAKTTPELLQGFVESLSSTNKHRSGVATYGKTEAQPDRDGPGPDDAGEDEPSFC